MSKKTILLITSDTGFGHRRAAQAVERVINDEYSDAYQAITVNPFEDPDLPDIIRGTETSYDTVVTGASSLYQLGYLASDTPTVARAMQDVTAAAMTNLIQKMLKRYEPSAIIATFPAYHEGILRARKNLGFQVPFTVVVTDLFDVHALWFHPKIDKTFVPSQPVYQQALDFKLKPEQIYLSGLPVQPDIARDTRTKREVKQALGWNPDMTTVLIVGSPRSRRTAVIAKLLDQAGLSLQIVALSGGLQETEVELRRTRWKGSVHTYGFVSNLPEMMTASDFIICKAGGLITTESLAAELPIIFCEALPGQEAGNVKYVTNAGAGVWAPDPVGVLATVVSWMARGTEKLDEFREAARNISRPRAAFDIAEQVVSMSAG